MTPRSLLAVWCNRISLALLQRQIDVQQTLLNMLKMNANTQMFTKLVTLDEQNNSRTIKDNELGGCLFVCFHLQALHLLSTTRLSIESLVRQLQLDGWRHVRLDQIAPGMIIVWNPKHKGAATRKVGFFISGMQAISTATHDAVPYLHDFELDELHGIGQILAHPAIHQKACSAIEADD